MLNRVLQVKMVRPRKEEVLEETIVTEDVFANRLYDIELVVQSIMFNVGIGVGAYILLDTFRQSAIAMASK